MTKYFVLLFRSLEYKRVLKDTFIIPYGGFVRFSFITNNPGKWKIDTKIGKIVFNIGDKHEIPIPPKNLSKCTDFEIDSNKFLNMVKFPKRARK